MFPCVYECVYFLLYSVQGGEVQLASIFQGTIVTHNWAMLQFYFSRGILKLLLVAGANLYAKTDENLLPIQVAADESIYKYLSARMRADMEDRMNSISPNTRFLIASDFRAGTVVDAQSFPYQESVSSGHSGESLNNAGFTTTTGIEQQNSLAPPGRPVVTIAGGGNRDWENHGSPREVFHPSGGGPYQSVGGNGFMRSCDGGPPDDETAAFFMGQCQQERMPTFMGGAWMPEGFDKSGNASPRYPRWSPWRLPENRCLFSLLAFWLTLVGFCIRQKNISFPCSLYFFFFLLSHPYLN